MFVKNIMVPKHQCVTVAYDESLQAALDRLERYDIDSVPVLRDGKYAGVVTRYGIYEDFFRADQPKESFLAGTKAGEAARRKDVYFHGQEVLEEALLILKSFPIVPIVDEEQRFAGIVTRTDVLEQFRSAFGVGRSGIRIAIACMESEGQIAKLSELTKSFHENIISLATFDEEDKLVRRIVLKVEKNQKVEKFISRLEQAGFKILSISET
ncbi:CBS domain-containing protein [Ectobacillus ponti]|uniref:CBS domain-containing protein n=1 Tax=Ectobacillus ponti TaxID=2961894 RepID=A0AA41X4D0_9BACI|nr:CBS domain-containing protein [Ectobacillus ponti]MCP8968729.1 CBS domain-containing protein [Ectobacillus ponti]